MQKDLEQACLGILLCKLGEDKIILEFKSLYIVSNIHTLDFQTAFFQICFCINDKPVCGYSSISVTATYEGSISIKVTILDEDNNPADGSIFATRGNETMQIQNDQIIQVVYGCTLLQYNTISLRANQEIFFRIRIGPGVNQIGFASINVTFPSCISCPIGFKQTISQLSGCNCKCDPKLITLSIVIGCNLSTGIIVKGHTTAWSTAVRIH